MEGGGLPSSAVAISAILRVTPGRIGAESGESSNSLPSASLPNVAVEAPGRVALVGYLDHWDESVPGFLEARLADHQLRGNVAHRHVRDHPDASCDRKRERPLRDLGRIESLDHHREAAFLGRRPRRWRDLDPETVAPVRCDGQLAPLERHPGTAAARRQFIAEFHRPVVLQRPVVGIEAEAAGRAAHVMELDHLALRLPGPGARPPDAAARHRGRTPGRRPMPAARAMRPGGRNPPGTLPGTRGKGDGCWGAWRLWRVQLEVKRDALRLGGHLARVGRQPHPESVFQERPRESAPEKTSVALPGDTILPPSRRPCDSHSAVTGPPASTGQDHVDASLPARPGPRVDAHLHAHVHVHGVDARSAANPAAHSQCALGREHLAGGIVQPARSPPGMPRACSDSAMTANRTRRPGYHGADRV